MNKKIIFLFLLTTLLSACISVSMDSDVKVTPAANFVTSTLPPTSSGADSAPLTLMPAAIQVTPTETIVPATAPLNCTDSAVLMKDVTIPDGTKVKAGEKFTKAWEFLNNGTCPWVDYTLVFAAGDQMGAPLSVPISKTVAKGEQVTLSVDLIAPTEDGEYTAYFTLKNTAGRQVPIGAEKTFWVKIVVGAGGNSLQQDTTSLITQTPHIPAGGNSNCAASSNSAYVQQLIAMINQARAAANLPRLSINDQLRSAAQAHSTDMACNNFLDHTGSDGSWINDRILQAGYTPAHYTEIIAIGSPQNAMDQWAASQSHWDAILDSASTEMGVGYAYYSASDFGGYFTVDFASP